MPRLHSVAKARTDQGNCLRCSKPIKAGDAYYWFKNRLGRMSIRKVFCKAHPPKASDMTTSDKLSRLYAAQETLEEAIAAASCTSDLVQALNEAAEQAREVGDGYRDSVSNMPENLQSSSTAQEMEEKADQCEGWADELESTASDIESDEWEAEAKDEVESDSESKDEDDSEPTNEEGDTEAEHLEKQRGLAEDVCGNQPL
jgi:uncharacterized phage infection (PIP) family protein YhgE